MIRTLQHKFVKTAMTAITLLLLVVIIAISVLYTVSVYSDARTMIEMLADSADRPGPWDEENRPDGGEYSEEMLEEIMEELREGESSDTDRQLGKKRGLWRGGDRISPDNAMAARFFLVKFAEDGSVERTDTSRIYSVTAQEAEQMAQAVLEGEKETGVQDRFLYLRRTDRSDSLGTTVVFMDISSQVSSVTSMLMISLAIFAVSWLLMLLFVMLLSKRAIAPIAENIVRQKQFVTNAGHELKTPLAIILANTEALELFSGESKWTRNIKAQTHRLSELMQNLLTLSKMDEAGTDLPLREFDLGSLIAEAAAPFEEPAREKGIDFQVEAPSITVKANRESIGQLIGILLDNAVKYTPEGGNILVRSGHSTPDSVFVSVRDNGIGIPEEDQPRLFERFYRVEKARTSGTGGTGLGLAIAKELVEAHGGRIALRSKLNVGTLMVVELPRQTKLKSTED